ncbi:hypothetical protein [Haladaptatus sp. NG-WS-4]
MTVERNTSVRYPGGKKSLWGAGAYLVGYVLTLPFAATRLTNATAATEIPLLVSKSTTLAELLEGAAVPTWKGAGRLFHNAHLVPVTVPCEIARLPPVSRNVVGAADGALSILFLVPPVLLVLAGRLAVGEG